MRISVSTTSRTHKDYTVGWICARKEELAAAKLMLDETHLDLSQLPNDPNRYILGSIGEQNIVIACAPGIGISRAAMVANRMISNFQNIKVGLSVGIGSGIPSKVKLGDVVVGHPEDKYPGVVQHDFGRMEDEGFKRIGTLNKPPTALLTALQDQQSDHDIYGFDSEQYLKDPRDGSPNMNTGYTHRPDAPEGASAQTGQGDRSQIHYGLIASGNLLIDDAKYRDSLDESLDGQVLCIETEAAGLVDDFPCLVIRGICDYADANKNDDWHEYAALVAAAYAKDFLKYTRVSG